MNGPNFQLGKLKPYGWIAQLLAWVISILLGGTGWVNYGRLADRLEVRTKDRYTLPQAIRDTSAATLDRSRLWHALDKMDARMTIQEDRPIPPPEVEKPLDDHENRIRALERIMWRLDQGDPEVRK